MCRALLSLSLLAASSRAAAVVEYERVALSSGATLNVAVAGERAAPTATVVMLHGFPEGSFAWSEMVAPLSEALPSAQVGQSEVEHVARLVRRGAPPCRHLTNTSHWRVCVGRTVGVVDGGIGVRA